eukprot:3948399-Lingulodinium_polyedra.AAC.1
MATHAAVEVSQGRNIGMARARVAPHRFCGAGVGRAAERHHCRRHGALAPAFRRGVARERRG